MSGTWVSLRYGAVSRLLQQLSQPVRVQQHLLDEVVCVADARVVFQQLAQDVAEAFRQLIVGLRVAAYEVFEYFMVELESVVQEDAHGGFGAFDGSLVDVDEQVEQVVAWLVDDVLDEVGAQQRAGEEVLEQVCVEVLVVDEALDDGVEVREGSQVDIFGFFEDDAEEAVEVFGVLWVCLEDLHFDFFVVDHFGLLRGLDQVADEWRLRVVGVAFFGFCLVFGHGRGGFVGVAPEKQLQNAIFARTQNARRSCDRFGELRVEVSPVVVAEVDHVGHLFIRKAR